ncbi:MAG TPA: fused MFS/spermidine synthase [Planctomycetota bacterium]|nr:fused MFS/spermidine synthase [Planctomycetota bacterium]
MGAFLLFTVQPLLSKWILPWFGGGSAVWTTCLLFFQTGLFAGYAYAHLSERLVGSPLRWALHLGLIALAAGLLPIAPEEAWKPVDEGRPALRILLLLAANVGAPYILLSSTGPLVQAWFSRAYPDRSVYRLYALSNLGSLGALVAFPFLIEPFMGLRRQAKGWTAAFLVLAGLLLLGILADRRAGRPGADAPPRSDGSPSLGRRLAWVALPAFASWMLAATTQQLTQDLAVIPFLWVMPLGVYLLSFILAFDHPRWYLPRLYAPLTAGLVLLAAFAYAFHATHSALLGVGILLVLGTLFAISMAAHGEVARLRPGTHHLTGYYLAIAGGGALGGLFVNGIAPAVFSTFLEWRLGMAIAYVGAWGMLAGHHRARIRAHLNVSALLLVLAGVGLALLGALFTSYAHRLETARNFYGVVAVEDASDHRDLVNGAILHGRQYLKGDLPRRPTTYFVEGSGIGRALGLFKGREDLRVGIVGLGAGTLAAYGERPSQSLRFYEINPEVTRLARRYFTYLGDCPARVEVIPGDARISLEREPSGRFHVLALDAFSGEAIPTHLLTAEAMAVYRRHLDPEGILAVHISNRFLDLSPVVRGMARAAGLRSVEIDFAPHDPGLGEPSLWILSTGSDSAFRELEKFATVPRDAREILWTDDRSDLWSVVRLR